MSIKLSREAPIALHAFTMDPAELALMFLYAVAIFLPAPTLPPLERPLAWYIARVGVFML